MIEGFQEQTEPLNEYEKTQLLPIMVSALKTKIGVEKAVTNKQMVEGLTQAGNPGVTPARIRKLINHIRINRLVHNLVSSSKGYYIATSKHEVETYVRSLMQRASAIEAVAKSYD